MSHHNTAFHQLLKPLSRHELEGLAKRHHCGQKLRVASRWDQFIAMAMSQIAGRQSLRDIESNVQSQHCKLYHLGAKPVSRTTLTRLNEKQPFELYQVLFYKLLGRVANHPAKHGFRFKNPLYSLDASLIDLSVNLFPWAQCNKDKAAVKLHVGLNHGNLIPEFVALTDGKESELIEGRKFAFPKGSIVAFDKGYVDYRWYRTLTDKGIFFVTRPDRTRSLRCLSVRRWLKPQVLPVIKLFNSTANMPSSAAPRSFVESVLSALIRDTIMCF